MITGIERESAKNFPASKTLPPPMAMIESQSFLSIRFFNFYLKKDDSFIFVYSMITRIIDYYKIKNDKKFY